MAIRNLTISASVASPTLCNKPHKLKRYTKICNLYHDGDTPHPPVLPPAPCTLRTDVPPSSSPLNRSRFDARNLFKDATPAAGIFTTLCASLNVLRNRSDNNATGYSSVSSSAGKSTAASDASTVSSDSSNTGVYKRRGSTIIAGTST